MLGTAQEVVRERQSPCQEEPDACATLLALSFLALPETVLLYTNHLYAMGTHKEAGAKIHHTLL